MLVHLVNKTIQVPTWLVCTEGKVYFGFNKLQNHVVWHKERQDIKKWYKMEEMIVFFRQNPGI